jgi:hypothetical protein
MGKDIFKRDRDIDGRRITFMAYGNGWVMCRHPGCTPFTLMEKEWDSLPFWEEGKEARARKKEVRR